MVYGHAPPIIHSYEQGTTSVAQVENSLRSRDETLKLLHENLVTAENRMKLNADRHRRELEFHISEFVCLRLQPFCQISIRT